MGDLAKAFVEKQMSDNSLYTVSSGFVVPNTHGIREAIPERATHIICDYCQQLYKIEDFEGGCKSCGAPAPRGIVREAFAKRGHDACSINGKIMAACWQSHNPQ